MPDIALPEAPDACPHCGSQNLRCVQKVRVDGLILCRCAQCGRQVDWDQAIAELHHESCDQDPE